MPVTLFLGRWGRIASKATQRGVQRLSRAWRVLSLLGLQRAGIGEDLWFGIHQHWSAEARPNDPSPWVWGLAWFGSSWSRAPVGFLSLNLYRKAQQRGTEASGAQYVLVRPRTFYRPWQEFSASIRVTGWGCLPISSA